MKQYCKIFFIAFIAFLTTNSFADLKEFGHNQVYVIRGLSNRTDLNDCVALYLEEVDGRANVLIYKVNGDKNFNLVSIKKENLVPLAEAIGEEGRSLAPDSEKKLITQKLQTLFAQVWRPGFESFDENLWSQMFKKSRLIAFHIIYKYGRTFGRDDAHQNLANLLNSTCNRAFVRHMEHAWNLVVPSFME